ncbi:3'(2'),5'-bisphosphate nucleotidase CysQ [Pontibacter sp. SGAir0037]|uniref:3'(2'),5'-bisphosphate nucleotidase CysQ n=1 Tax=Pontibacter sp. SGAir0037 TaxID=2571030 RepID=UPI0010CD21A2|nr:3'(2'),5'-bisphosphate nucleotidase CysQ [Pontibacter sp. SGAir0037]QCR20967.1 3'(2'),5'-bisphosphate nucleotidase [Pontibacter sp. SGAir0037]
MQAFVHKSILAAIEAGKKILEVYAGDFSADISFKSDNSPVTIADYKANQVIESYLADTSFPILSEEGTHLAYEERKSWNAFWLIDPLDGTKEFIKKNDEFTVNIALVRDGKPVLGVVYVPVAGTLYYGAEGEGSFVFNVDAAFHPERLEEYLLHATQLPLAKEYDIYTILLSLTHSCPETQAFVEERKNTYGEVKIESAGSSLKLCLVAEGKAQVYPRLGPTMEWDTAAGHAVAKYAGCMVYDFETKQELVYNKENLLNPWFVVEQELPKFVTV